MSSPKISSEFREGALKSDFSNVSPADMADLPVPLLLQISVRWKVLQLNDG